MKCPANEEKKAQILEKKLVYHCSIKWMPHECKESECEQREKSGCRGPKEYAPCIQVLPCLIKEGKKHLILKYTRYWQIKSPNQMHKF